VRAIRRRPFGGVAAGVGGPRRGPEVAAEFRPARVAADRVRRVSRATWTVTFPDPAPRPLVRPALAGRHGQLVCWPSGGLNGRVSASPVFSNTRCTGGGPRRSWSSIPRRRVSAWSRTITPMPVESMKWRPWRSRSIRRRPGICTARSSAGSTVKVACMSKSPVSVATTVSALVVSLMGAGSPAVTLPVLPAPGVSQAVGRDETHEARPRRQRVQGCDPGAGWPWTT